MYELISIFVLAFGYCRDIMKSALMTKVSELLICISIKKISWCLRRPQRTKKRACVWAQTTRGQRDRSTFVDGRTTRELIQVERHGYSARAVRQPSRGRSKTGSKQKRNTHKMKKETREQHKHDIIRLTITTTVHQFHLFYCQNKQR